MVVLEASFLDPIMSGKLEVTTRARLNQKYKLIYFLIQLKLINIV